MRDQGRPSPPIGFKSQNAQYKLMNTGTKDHDKMNTAKVGNLNDLLKLVKFKNQNIRKEETNYKETGEQWTRNHGINLKYDQDKIKKNIQEKSQIHQDHKHLSNWKNVEHERFQSFKTENQYLNEYEAKTAYQSIRNHLKQKNSKPNKMQLLKVRVNARLQKRKDHHNKEKPEQTNNIKQLKSDFCELIEEGFQNPNNYFPNLHIHFAKKLNNYNLDWLKVLAPMIYTYRKQIQSNSKNDEDFIKYVVRLMMVVSLKNLNYLFTSRFQNQFESENDFMEKSYQFSENTRNNYWNKIFFLMRRGDQQQLANRRQNKNQKSKLLEKLIIFNENILDCCPQIDLTLEVSESDGVFERIMKNAVRGHYERVENVFIDEKLYDDIWNIIICLGIHRYSDFKAKTDNMFEREVSRLKQIYQENYFTGIEMTSLLALTAFQQFTEFQLKQMSEEHRINFVHIIILLFLNPSYLELFYNKNIDQKLEKKLKNILKRCSEIISQYMSILKTQSKKQFNIYFNLLVFQSINLLNESFISENQFIQNFQGMCKLNFKDIQDLEIIDFNILQGFRNVENNEILLDNIFCTILDNINPKTSSDFLIIANLFNKHGMMDRYYDKLIQLLIKLYIEEEEKIVRNGKSTWRNSHVSETKSVFGDDNNEDKKNVVKEVQQRLSEIERNFDKETIIYKIFEFLKHFRELKHLLKTRNFMQLSRFYQKWTISQESTNEVIEKILNHINNYNSQAYGTNQFLDIYIFYIQKIYYKRQLVYKKQHNITGIKQQKLILSIELEHLNKEFDINSSDNYCIVREMLKC